MYRASEMFGAKNNLPNHLIGEILVHIENYWELLTYINSIVRVGHFGRRLEVKKWKGKMEPRKREIRKSETALDFSWKAGIAHFVAQLFSHQAMAWWKQGKVTGWSKHDLLPPYSLMMCIVEDNLARMYIYYSVNKSYIHTFIHTYIRTFIHSYIHTVHSYIHTFKHSYIHTFIHSYIHTCIHAYIHTFIHTYIHTFIYSYIHTFIHTYIQTYINTVINTVIQLYSQRKFRGRNFRVTDF